MGKEFYLVYINALNQNYRGENIYEFIFSDTVEIQAGLDWEVEPASAGNATPPPIEFIKGVATLKTKDVELLVIQHSDNFSMYDAVEKIIALGWESTSNDVYDRLVFHFGDTFESVKEKFYERDLIISLER